MVESAALGSRNGGGRRCLVIAFFAGRYSPHSQEPEVAQTPSGVRERVLLVAVGDHLERSEMLLIEIANANPRQAMNIVEQRETAQDLVLRQSLVSPDRGHIGRSRRCGSAG